MENLQIQELRKKALELRKDDVSITLNEYVGPLNQHRRFCELLSISGTGWAKDREEQILRTGRAEAYKKAALEDRIISTEGVEIPSLEVKEVEEIEEGSGAAEADGPADRPPPA